MGNRQPVSFKDNELENILWDYLQEQSKLIGASAYIKQLIYEDMIRKKSEIPKLKNSTER